MRVGVGLREKAYTPEAYAYKIFLEQSGMNVQLASENDLYPDNDVNIYFMGLRPFWRKKRGEAYEIHEYQSLSLAPYSFLKDHIKSIVNGRPDGRIFLNESVRGNMNFILESPYILRDMGVEASLFQKPDACTDFDIVYSGSIAGREGLLEEIQRLSDFGYKVLIIGEVSHSVLERFAANTSVEFAGRVSREDLPALYRRAWAGLNYTPDVHPFNIQTSTKTLEYLASGLVVFSNKYHWASKFSHDHGVNFIWLHELQPDLEISPCSLDSRFFFDATDFRWEKVLERSGLLTFISRLER